MRSYELMYILDPGLDEDASGALLGRVIDGGDDSTFPTPLAWLDDQTLVVFTSDNGPWLAVKERGGSAGALPEGECSNDAQARALRHLKSPAGLQEAQSADGKPKLRAIQSMLGQIQSQIKAA